MSNWMIIHGNYAIDLDKIRAITTLRTTDKDVNFLMRFSSQETEYTVRFEYNDYVETKEELYHKVELIRDKIILQANKGNPVTSCTANIDLKKKIENKPHSTDY